MAMKLTYLFVSLCSAYVYQPRYIYDSLLMDQGPDWADSVTYNATELQNCLNATSYRLRYWSSTDSAIAVSVNGDMESSQINLVFKCLEQQNPPRYNIELTGHSTAEKDKSMYEEEVDSNGLVTLHGHVCLTKSLLFPDGTMSARIIDTTPWRPMPSNNEPDNPGAVHSSDSEILRFFLAPLMRRIFGGPVYKRHSS